MNIAYASHASHIATVAAALAVTGLFSAWRSDAFALFDTEDNALKRISHIIYSFIHHLYQLLDVRYPVAVDDQYHHHFSAGKSGFHDKMTHQTFLPSGIPRSDVILRHETPESVGSRHSWQRLEITISAIHHQVTPGLEKSNSRLSQIFHDTALPGDYASRTDGKLRLIPVSERPTAIVVALIHADDRHHNRFFQPCQPLQLFPHLALLEFKLLRILQFSIWTAAAPLIEKNAIEFTGPIRRCLYHLHHICESIVLLDSGHLRLHLVPHHGSRDKHYESIGLSYTLAFTAHILYYDLDAVTLFQIIPLHF